VFPSTCTRSTSGIAFAHDAHTDRGVGALPDDDADARTGLVASIAAARFATLLPPSLGFFVSSPLPPFTTSFEGVKLIRDNRFSIANGPVRGTTTTEDLKMHQQRTSFFRAKME